MVIESIQGLARHWPTPAMQHREHYASKTHRKWPKEILEAYRLIKSGIRHWPKGKKNPPAITTHYRLHGKVVGNWVFDGRRKKKKNFKGNDSYSGWWVTNIVKEDRSKKRRTCLTRSTAMVIQSE
jgi:hypothetical protein